MLLGSITSGYIRGASLCVIVFDVTLEKSLESAEYWEGIIRNELGESSLILLLGNKIDLINERIISPDKGKEVADKLRLQYFETSAKTGAETKNIFKIVAAQLKETAEKQGIFLINRLSN